MGIPLSPMSSLHESLNFRQTSTVSTTLKDDVQSKEEGKTDDKVETTQIEEPTTTATQQGPQGEEERKEEPTPVVDESQTAEELQKTYQVKETEEKTMPTTVQDTLVDPDVRMDEAKPPSTENLATITHANQKDVPLTRTEEEKELPKQEEEQATTVPLVEPSLTTDKPVEPAVEDKP